MPWAWVMVRIDVRTERKVCGTSADNGVDWRFVRTSSRGETILVIIVRAKIPDARGTIEDGNTDGRTLCERWSYVSM